MRFAIVFGGGNALGAYDAGAFEAVARRGLEPGHVAGASIGAITAALVAGNPPERRVEALRAFWDAVSAPEAVLTGGPWLPTAAKRATQWVTGLQARLFGQPGIFIARPMASLDAAATPGLYDHAPLRRTLAGLIDLDRLNDGPMRLSILAVDAETGAEAVFDNRHTRLTLDHVLASSAMLPNFPPVGIEGRLFVDGGLAANLPAHLVLDPPVDGIACLLVDPYPLAAPPPSDLSDAQQRQEDLLFASQSRRTLAALERSWAQEARFQVQYPPSGVAWRIEYQPDDDETALKSFSFGAAGLQRRWQRGIQDAAAALDAWGGEPPGTPGLLVHGIGAGVGRTAQRDRQESIPTASSYCEISAKPVASKATPTVSQAT